ncbi:MAG: universal stress protein [Pseudomonadota bacterium]|jgi:nucleotide-binding universal stress UspA family protein|nr:universal stress protein [Pseudomonadota bacterium]MEE3071809.1 universal stress protein [Pseudomonadota bacterium]
MSNTIVVAYDGNDSAKRALAFAVERAKVISGNVVVAHVLEWSPYKFLTPQEIEERHARRQDELSRAEAALLTPVKEEYASSGVPISTVIKYGHVSETLIKLATAEGAVQLIIGRTGEGALSSRLFGSVAGTLAQTCPIPVTIVP